MGLYDNDSLKNTPREYLPASRADEIADIIARFALVHQAPLIRIVIYSITKDKALTARICKCDRKTIDRLINSLETTDSPGLDLSLLAQTADSAQKATANSLESIKEVVELLKPFSFRNNGNPKDLGVTPDEFDNALKVLSFLLLRHNKPSHNMASDMDKSVQPEDNN